jgi:hypothetical protein
LRPESCCRYAAQLLLSENPGERFSHWIFGSDLDGVIVKEGDLNAPNAKDTSKCQQAAARWTLSRA